MPPLAAWEKVLVDGESMAEDEVHAEVTCIACHAGTNSDDMTVAHEGMILDPSANPTASCGSCHPDVQAAHEVSLHATLAGYDNALNERTVPENHPQIDEMQTFHCESCHATCGDCHIAQPDTVGGGLLEGHAILGTPPMTRTCTACHGSRVGNEYLGKNEGIPADVHFTQGRMTCVDCHTGDELHGVGMEDVDHRYDGARTPKCEDCHADVGGSNEYHTNHTLTVSCQVCHSVEYTNCTNCHVEQTPEGIPFYTVEAHETGFFIARNANPSFEYPFLYGVVRHVPVDPDQYAFYGDNLLPNFDNRPTFAWATPHNIQLYTPQSIQCSNCHGNRDIFLTADKVPEGELEANLSIITEPPLPVEELLKRFAPPAIEEDSGN